MQLEKIGPRHTAFITSTCTILYNAHSVLHDRDADTTTTTTVTTIGESGDTLAGFIHWPRNIVQRAVVIVGGKQLRMTPLDSRDDAMSLIFLATNGECYQWRRRYHTFELLRYYDIHSTAELERTPVALYISGHNLRSRYLYIQPSGFQILHDIVISFICYEWVLRVVQCQWAQTRYSPLQQPLQSRNIQYPNILLSLMETPLKILYELNRESKLLSGAQYQHHSTSTSSPSLQFVQVVQPKTSQGRPRILLDHHDLPDLTDQIVKQDEFPVASGGFGDVWRCWWNTSGSRVVQVAVKAIRINTSDREVLDRRLKRLSRELQLWRRLRHENILPLYGFTNDFSPFPAMVCPWVHGGTLNNYLQECHENLHGLHRFCLLRDIAAGLQYLHSLMIVHGDLTGTNVLIQPCGQAYLADFGLSTLLLEFVGTSNFTTSIRGNIRWAAPELFDIPVADDHENRYLILPSPRGDIYSFGSIMMQVLSGKVPYHWIKNEVQILTLVLKGAKPTRPEDPRIADRHWDFIQACWSTEEHGKHRPRIGEVVRYISAQMMACIIGSLWVYYSWSSSWT